MIVVRRATTSYLFSRRSRCNAQALSLPPLQLSRMRFGAGFGWLFSDWTDVIPPPVYTPLSFNAKGLQRRIYPQTEVCTLRNCGIWRKSTGNGGKSETLDAGDKRIKGWGAIMIIPHHGKTRLPLWWTAPRRCAERWVFFDTKDFMRGIGNSLKRVLRNFSTNARSAVKHAATR